MRNSSRFRSLADLEPHCGRTPEDLSAGEALALVDNFRGLEWWLKPEVLDRAYVSPLAAMCLPGRRENDMPDMPQEPGCLVIVAAVPETTLAEFPILRPGLVIPLQWARVADPTADHDPRLPDALRELADDVLGKIAEKEDRLWRLGLGPGVDRAVDLSRFELGWESGWAALAAALNVAIRGGGSRRDVWASARWTARGIDRVEGLAAKLALAISAGVRHFFVPEDQVDEAKHLVTERGATGLEIHGLKSGETKPEPALGPLLEQLQVEPGPDLPRDRRVRWFLNLPGKLRDDYYYRCLFDDVVSRCRRDLDASNPDAARWRPALLVTILSKAPTWLVGASALEPERCLLLYTDDDPDVMKLVKPGSQRFRVRLGDRSALEPRAFEGRGSDPSRIVEILQEAFQGTPADRIAIDLTPGASWMKLALLRVSPPSSRLVCILHDFDARSRCAEPFTERIWLSTVKQALQLEETADHRRSPT